MPQNLDPKTVLIYRPHPVKEFKYLSLALKTVFKLSEKLPGMFLPDTVSRGQKALDPHPQPWARPYLNGREIPKKDPPEETVVLHILDVVDEAPVLVLILGSHVTKYTLQGKTYIQIRYGADDDISMPHLFAVITPHHYSIPNKFLWALHHYVHVPYL